MVHSDTDPLARKKPTTSYFKPIVPALAPHSRGPALIRPASILSTFSPVTPDPSPIMSPEDPKFQQQSYSRRNSGSTTTAASTITVHDQAFSGRTASGSSQHLPTFSDLSKPTGTPSSSSSSSSSTPTHSSSRALHTLYPQGTPPMSPGVGHGLISPITGPHRGITDPSHYSSSSSSSSGFYQLPPPLQPFAPRQSPHQSPAMQPQPNHGHNSSLTNLPSLPPPSVHSNSGYSPRSTPQMSPRYMVSPALGPLSPYPTPQHQPRHFSSPHSDPLTSKQSIPAMILPASALSSTNSNGSSHDNASVRSYSAALPQQESDTVGSPIAGPVADSSAPSSPRRYMMLPPQSPSAPISTSRRSSRSQGRKTSAESSPTSTSTSTTTRRRTSSSAKLIDQETRDLMRKVSHSAIERRRRERINDKILQLKHLVPACVDEDHLHKLSILQSTIEYIQHLKAILPASIANAKVGKATNNNPNNKTTDMLEALGGSISSKSPLTPLMTTGLNHIYEKRIRIEKQDIRALLEDHGPTVRQQIEQKQKQKHQQQQHVSSSSPSFSSDEDAKDGLLLLANQSSSISEAATGASSDESGSTHEFRPRKKGKHE
ncbi:hypothetical protein BX616_010028 [Lobosporangium transversale]|uniref:BHLH domain-containing protein n=1 Tax=Lobosporangium transversale TaxID=64571 RepID=A0A1Y2G9S0_9FUNG|nr:hypothetical protein BCR41DRAFT_363837 [Lobosporangium transversale]KAF9913442.1 hypothetical protein BX616_010028 [Lobosporangium transversale]ORY99702.1 hypothetical protein BCR41DRAFT_363837 [Lobosporangium transversale]|eukprot:XP_021875966.1 hypothetical protein BCR41DRAFT_363837 [Lobosporangium transversale]